MLNAKMLFIFRTRGVRFLFVAGSTDQIVTWLLHVYIYASEEEMWWTHGDLRFMYGYISVI